MKALILAVLLGLPLTAAASEKEPASPFAGMPLPLLMHQMQYYALKLGLAVDADNRALQRFYSEEIEEVVEAVEQVGDHEGHDLKKLVESIFEPAFRTLQQAVADGTKEQVDQAYVHLLETCNACHRGADRPFVVIERNHNNPFPQRFAP